MNAALRELVRRRAEGRCEYCRLPQSAEPLTLFHIEHVIARQHGVTNDPSNLALACYRCNLHKGPNLAGIDPETDQVIPLFHPRREAWLEHFRFVGPRIVGRTPTGRATIRVLNFNAKRRLKLRSDLGLSDVK